MATLLYWSKPLKEVVACLHSSCNGLSEETQAVLRHVESNTIKSKERVTPLGLFLNQFKSPIVLILIFATIVSAFLSDWVGASIILLIVVGSALLSFSRDTMPTMRRKNCREQQS